MNEIDPKTKQQRRDTIQRLQESMIDIRCDMPEAEHIFTPGIYARKFSMPAGMTVVGKTHAHEHLMIVLKGSAEVATDEGVKTVYGGDVFVSPVGAKRVVLALENVEFLTVHHNPENTKDLDEIEEHHIVDEGVKNIYHKSPESCIENKKGGYICRGE